VRGGSDRSAFYALTFDEVGPRLVAAGLLTSEELERAGSFVRDPAGCWLSLALVSAWGRRPAGPPLD
jgi:hypothetical protein